MSKKKQLIIISVAVLCGLILAGYGIFLLSNRTDTETIAKVEHTYDADYHSFCSYEHDKDMDIDGVLEEDVWKNKNWYTNTYLANTNGTMPTLKVTGFSTEYGVYIASVVEDNNLVNDGQRSPSKNSNWELYVSAANVGVEQANDGLYTNAFHIDMRGDVYSRQTNIDRAVVVDGKLNSGETKGATLEVFIPWAVLGVDVTKGVPTEFRVLPEYRALFEGQNGTTPMRTQHSNSSSIKDYYRFNENGYMSADREGALVGDNKFGYAKTGNWDITKEEKGIVESAYGTEYHSIFFADEFGSNFIVEANIKFAKALENAYPKAGFAFRTTSGSYYSVMLDMAESNLVDSVGHTKNIGQYKLVAVDTNDTWKQFVLSQFDRVNQNASKREGVKLTVVKYGADMWYFADGVFLGEENISFMDTDVFPALFTMGADVVFTDYSCTNIDENALTKYLNDRNLYVIDAKIGSAGGNVKVSSASVKKGENCDVTITSNTGYQVSSVLINGKEKIADVKSKAVDGVYTLTGIKTNQEIKVSFEKCKGNQFTGVVTSGDEAVAAKVIICGSTNKALRYEVSAMQDKGFSVSVPNGTYKVFVEAEGCKTLETSVNIKRDKKQNYKLETTGFPSSVTVNGKKLTSQLDKWDVSEEHKGKVSGSFAQGTKMAPLYFSKTGKDFAIETTIHYTTQFKDDVSYQPDLMGGFIFHDGTNYGWIVARETGTVSTGWKFTDGLLEKKVLTYPEKKSVHFAVAKKGEDLYVYFDNVMVAKKAWSEVAPKVNANSEMALGLYMIADKVSDIEFTNYKLSVGTSAANSYITSHEVKDGVVSNNDLFATALTVNGKKVQSMTNKWDLSEPGAVKGSYAMGSKLQPLYFVKHGKTALISTTIEYTTDFVEGKEYQPDLMGGFYFTDGTNKGWLMANKRGVVYTGWKFQQNLIKDAVLTYPEKRSVKLTIAVKDNNIYIYMNDVYVLKRSTSVVIPNVASNADLAFGLVMVADKTADIKFTNTSITTNENDVNNYMKR